MKVPQWVAGWGVRLAYRADENSFIGRLFARYAPNAAASSVEGYVVKAQAAAGPVFGLMLVGLLLVIALVWLAHLKRVRVSLWQESFPPFFQKSQPSAYKMWLAVILAGALWGGAISTRATGITAGGMIGLYMMLRLREKSILPLLVYTFSAAAACFITWPYLWYFGFKGFIGAMRVFADYPYEGGRIWFRGSIPHSEIPRTFLLQVMAIQFTEPLVILIIAGVVLAVVYAIRKQLPRLDIFILMCWFFLPILFSIATKPTHYNNFRQFFFITPPLFVFAGLTLEKISQYLKRGVILPLMLLLVFAPGIVESIRLHPYQYVYYNQFVGGVEGAYRYYEMDYWVISYKEAMEYINTHAPEGAVVAKVGGGDVPRQYARSDLIMGGLPREGEEAAHDIYYLLLTTNHRHPLPLVLYSLETVYEVRAGGAVLTYVKVFEP
jgi:hypothetical protein